ncbi:MAG: hypothetical protein Q7T83_04445 [Thermodesulfovibrionales bacterium]|nr:hypothetical protein [Thermodesulfovibrionales bacterium]MDP3111042.1 hypothetical protein [Thermodesulfovibrionales bacterium]
MVVTAKAADGKELGKVEKHYHPQATNCRDFKMKYGAQWKVANLRDTSLQPGQAKKETVEFDLPEGVRTADVTIELFYEATNPDQKYPIHTVTRKVSLDK